MKNLLPFILFVVIFSSCSTNRNLTASFLYNPTLTEDLPVTSALETELITKKDTMLINGEYISFGEEKKLWNSGSIRITKTDESNLSFDEFKLKIGFSREKYPSDGSYYPLIRDVSRYKTFYTPKNSTYSFEGKTLNDLIRQENGEKKLVHGNWINIKITDDNDNVLYSGNFQYKKDFAWFTKVSTPLLYVADGDLGEFELRKFSPSIGVTILQKNINTTSKWNYLGLNGLIDVQSWEQEIEGEPTQTKYSIGAGFTLEIAGYFQFGYTYNFNEENWSFVIGATPELIQKLFGIKE